MLYVKSYKINIVEILRDLDLDKSWTVVTPSPLKSDIFREIIIGQSLAKNISSITISKFVNDQLSLFDLERKSKSKLMMELWTIWKLKVNKDLGMFRFAFDLFTEIRSYSLSSDIFEEIKEYVEENVYESLIFFNQYFINAEIVDEQRSYQYCAENFKSLGENLIFWGFDHINANQIDLIKNVSSSVDVIVALPQDVFTELSNLDWPSWLGTNEFEAEEALESKYQLNAFQVSKSRVSEYLDEIKNDESAVYLIDKNIDLLKAQSLVGSDSALKSSFDIFATPLKGIMIDLRALYESKKEIALEELIELLMQRQRQEFSVQAIREFKVTSKFIGVLEEFSSLSQENESIELEDINLLKEVIELDLPRTSVISNSKKLKNPILERDYLNLVGKDNGGYLFVDVSSESMLKDNSLYSAELLSVFSAYGPLQSKNVENLLLKNLLVNFCLSNGVLIYEEGSFDESYEWEKILKDFDLNTSFVSKENKVIKNYLNAKKQGSVGKLSATKIQSYIDCPRKYYYNYIEKLNLSIRSEIELSADLRGIVEHLVIEEYLNEFSEFNFEALEKLSLSILNRIITDNKLRVSAVEVRSALVEVISYVEDTICLLLDVKKAGAKLSFEYDISKFDPNASGRIDLMIEFNEDIYLFDFKRSKYGIPTKTELESFEKVQIWFYLTRLEQREKIKGFGYINLSEIADSLVYEVEGSVLGDLLIDQFKRNKLKAPFLQSVAEYLEYENEVNKKMNADQRFEILPASDKACAYCVAKSVCSKGEISENS